jgi:acetylornithine deacetylase/succinyl-diaminopimelate desuccinylase-like protein
VAFFAGHGVPAVNLGPGEPTLAHTVGECLERAPLEFCFTVLRDLLEHGT